MPARVLRFSVLPGRFAICRLAAEAPLPAWALGGSFSAVARTGDELSIVCAQESLPQGVEAEQDYLCLKLTGPFALTETGVLASFLAPLAEQGVPVFAVSTYDTDYVLIPARFEAVALEALRAAGHERVQP